MVRVSSFASVTMIVHEITGPPVYGLFDVSPQTGKAQHAPVGGCDVIRLPAVRPFEPLVIAAGWNGAPMACERIPEHGLVGDSLRPRVETGGQLLQGLFPPPRNEPPAHRDEFTGAPGSQLHDIDRISGRNVVVGLQIARRAVREGGKVLTVVPEVASDESRPHSIHL